MLERGKQLGEVAPWRFSAEEKTLCVLCGRLKVVEGGVRYLLSVFQARES